MRTVPRDTIADLIAVGESANLAFKSSFDRQVIETLVAFVNFKGGTVLVGGNNRGEIGGVALGPETAPQRINQVKSVTAPSSIPDVEPLTVDGKTVARISISEYPVKPVSCKGKYYKRINNSNHQLSLPEISDLHLQTFNPVRLLGGLSAEQLVRGNYSSAIRNKQIAAIFKEAGTIEKYGSGIKGIIDAFTSFGLPASIFEEFQHGFRATVFGETTQKTTQKTAVGQLLDLLRADPRMSCDELAVRLDKNPNTVKYHIKKLKDQGRIERIGSDRDGYWRVINHDS